jgi:hypothetical protein
VQALEEQSTTRATAKIKHAQATSGQAEIFQSLHDMAPDDLTAFRETERRAAAQALLKLTPREPDGILYHDLWPLILARHVVRKVEVNKIAARLRREGELLIPNWEKNKQVPQSSYRLQRPKS